MTKIFSSTTGAKLAILAGFSLSSCFAAQPVGAVAEGAFSLAAARRAWTGDYVGRFPGEGVPALYASVALPAKLPVALLPQAAASRAPLNPQPGAASSPNWFHRHSLVLGGLAMMGTGAALIATGGPGPVSSYCIGVGPTGPVCTAPGPVWLGGQRLTGVLVGGLGVPVTILGLLRH